VNADFGDILKHLKGVFATTLIARNETFIAGLDFMWSRIGVDVNVKANGNGPYANLRSGTAVSFQQDQTIATVFAGYRIPIGSPDLSLYGTVGARYQNITAKINLSKQFAGIIAQQPLGFSLTVQGTQAWADPLVGLAMNYRINDKWFVNGYGDVGGFGVASKLTSLGQIAVGYNWTQSFSTTLGYRALYYDYKKNNGNGGSFRYVTTTHGPVVGLSYNF